MIIFHDDTSKHKYRIAIISSIRPSIFSAKKCSSNKTSPMPNAHIKSELKRYAKEEIHTRRTIQKRSSCACRAEPCHCHSYVPFCSVVPVTHDVTSSVVHLHHTQYSSHFIFLSNSKSS